MRPKLLAITSAIPWPLDSGGRLRTFHLQSALAKACDLRLIAPVPPGSSDYIPALMEQGIHVIAVPVPDRTRRAEFGRVLQARRHGEPYALYGRHARPEVGEAIERELREKPDLVWLDHLDSFLFEPLARAAGVKTVIDLHNIYSLILARMADATANPLKKWFLRGEAKRLAKREARACETCDAVLAVSQAEAEHFRKLGSKRVVVAANGVDCAAFAELPTGRMDAKPIVLFVGTLNWGPNVAAALALAKEIFPLVRAQMPEAELRLVGKDPAPEVKALAGAGITVAGSVPSIVPYLKDAALLAVPLDSGGGTRLKILEAFAAGLPVVSTAVGAEGIEAIHDHHFLIAERKQMANIIVRLLCDSSQGVRLAEAARQLAVGKYDWPRIGAACVKMVTEITGI